MLLLLLLKVGETQSITHLQYLRCVQVDAVLLCQPGQLVWWQRPLSKCINFGLGDNKSLSAAEKLCFTLWRSNLSTAEAFWGATRPKEQAFKLAKKIVLFFWGNWTRLLLMVRRDAVNISSLWSEGKSVQIIGKSTLVQQCERCSQVYKLNVANVYLFLVMQKCSNRLLSSLSNN